MNRVATTRKVGIVAAVLTMLVLTVSMVAAAVTWHDGPNFSGIYDGSTLIGAHADGDGSGFGNQPAVATIALAAAVSYTCQNPGGNQAPGIHPVNEVSSTSAPLNNADHNGRGTFSFDATFTPAPTVSGKAIGCPNGNWTGINPVWSGITSATLTITQANKLIYGPVVAPPFPN
jgi:hypothetical protein